jgi:hypothetical protein
VGDPLCHLPFFAPWSSWRGSLTPQTHVTFVRRDRACTRHLSRAPHNSTACAPPFTWDRPHR